MRISPKRSRIRQPRNGSVGWPVLFGNSNLASSLAGQVRCLACRIVRSHNANVALHTYLCKGFLT